LTAFTDLYDHFPSFPRPHRSLPADRYFFYPLSAFPSLTSLFDARYEIARAVEVPSYLGPPCLPCFWCAPFFLSSACAMPPSIAFPPLKLRVCLTAGHDRASPQHCITGFAAPPRYFCTHCVRSCPRLLSLQVDPPPALCPAFASPFRLTIPSPVFAHLYPSMAASGYLPLCLARLHFQRPPTSRPVVFPSCTFPASGLSPLYHTMFNPFVSRDCISFITLLQGIHTPLTHIHRIAIYGTFFPLSLPLLCRPSLPCTPHRR